MVGSIRRRVAAWLAIGMSLALGIAMLVVPALTIGPGGSAALAAGAPVVQTYTTCPTFSTLQTYLQGIQSGSTVVVNLPQDCQYLPASPSGFQDTGAIQLDAGATVTINGNGLVLDGGTQGDNLIVLIGTSGIGTGLTLNQVTLRNDSVGVDDESNGFAASVTLNQSTVQDMGYGVYVGSVTVDTSTIVNNVGIGLYADNVTASNSTIAHNGDGINSNTSLLTNDTIVDNTGWGVDVSQTSNLTANILAHNGDGVITHNCTALVSSSDHGYNLATDDTCGLTASTSHEGSTVASGLDLVNNGTPGNYGGLTQTIALGSGSMAIDQIPVNNAGQCAYASGNGAPILDPVTNQPLTADQRGVPRPQGAGCDIGAYEAIQGPYTVSESQCPTQQQLQGDFDLANSLNGKLLTINIEPAGCQITLTSALTIGPNTDISINGNGLTLDGQDLFDIIDINDTTEQPSTLTVNQMTIEHGGGGGIFDSNVSAGTTIRVNQSAFNDAGEYPIEGTNVFFDDSTMTNGPFFGIVATNATVTSSTITNNDAAEGFGGINATNATVTATILSGNTPNCAVTNLIDGGYNLSDDGSCAFTSPTSRPSTAGTAQPTASQLGLLPLGNYGGDTPTIGLTLDSIAVDAIPLNPNGTCSVGEQIDQRGVSRPQGAGCDIGAFELVDLVAGLPGSTTAVHQGYWALIRIEALSATGQNISSRTLPVASVELDGPNGQTIAFAQRFQFGRFDGVPGYQLEINTRNLSPGRWRLVIKTGSGATASTGWVSFTVE